MFFSLCWVDFKDVVLNRRILVVLLPALEKSTEELAEDGPNAGNRKLVPIVTRHGGGLDDGDYINMVMQGSHAKLFELKTRNEFKNQPVGDTGLISTDSLIKLKIENGLEEIKTQTEWKLWKGFQ